MSAAAQTVREVKTVQLGSLPLGTAGVVVLGGRPAGEPDARWITLGDGHGGRPAGEVLEEARREWAGPLLAEPYRAGDLEAAGRWADGVIVGDADLAAAAAAVGLPVVVRRGPGASLDEWLAVADRCVEEGGDQVVLCEGGTPLDLGLMRAARERSGRPVLAFLGAGAGLAGAAVAAGADGLLLAPSAGEDAVRAAREAAVVVGAVVRREEPGSVLAARGAIDRVDAALATLLERRAELAGVVQRLKPVGGFAGRDMDRERRLVDAMARRAPRLGAARLQPVMNAVIEAGLALAEERRRTGAG